MKLRKAMAGMLALAFVVSGLGITAPDSAAASKPKLKKKKISVTKGKTKKITIKGKKIKKTKWSVKSKKVAKLTKKKKTSVTVKGLKAGKSTKVTAKVTVKGKKKAYKLTCKVTVKKAKPSKTPAPGTKTTAPGTTTKPGTTATIKPAVDADIKLDRTALTVPYNASIQLNAAVTPASEASRVVWSSSNTAVATVKDGMVKGIEKGTAVITAAIGSKKAVCDVTVTKEEFGTVVMNCDFNDGEIKPWGPRAASTAPTAVIDENGYDGKCLKITDRTSPAQGALLDLSEMVEPSATYEFSTYVKLGDTASDNAAIILSTETKAVAGGEEVYANVKCITTAQSNWACSADYILKDPKQWSQVTYQVTTPDDVSHFGLYFEGGNSANDDLYVDSTSLKLLSRNVPDYTIPSLYDTYKDIFKYMGVAVDYNQLMGENTMRFIKAQYNSVTMGNAMKPDAILPSTTTDRDFVTVEEAKKLGYYVTDDYASYAENQKAGEVVYPKLRLEPVDDLLKRAHDQGLKMRFHVLVWHQQTPVLFFKNTFASGVTRKNASKEAMNARLEWYTRTVLDHILKGPYADVIYAVDVVNEYFHSHNAADADKPTFWEAIYDTEDKSSSGKMSTNPSYVKLAFKSAYDVLKANKRTDISLIYNDYNTYGEDTADRMITMCNWLNTQDDINTAGDKICSGVGMQSHLSVTGSYHSVDKFTTALNKFCKANLEVQITELDATRDGATAKEEAEYWKKIMKALIDAKKAGGNITSVTIWGLYDSTSWRAEGKPLPFTGLFHIKDNFTALIEAAQGK